MACRGAGGGTTGVCPVVRDNRMVVFVVRSWVPLIAFMGFVVLGCDFVLRIQTIF